MTQRMDGALEGWCWSPSRADARLNVDILLNDDVAATVTASRPRPGLAAEGRGDGRHGFALDLPGAIANARRPYAISARERSTSRIFARIVHDGPAMDNETRDRLESISANIEALRDELGQLLAPLESRATLPGSLGPLSATLAARAELRRRPNHVALSIAAARAALHRSEMARRGGLPCIQTIAAPRANLVLQAASWVEDTLDALHAMAPAIAAAAADVVLLGPGQDVRTSLLPGLVPGLRLMDALGSEVFGARVVLLFAAGRHEPCGSTLSGISDRVESGAIILGGAAVDAANRAGVDVRGAEATAPDTLLLACRSADLMLLGGFDPAFDEDPGLASADIALRASLLGMPVLTAAPVQPTGAASAPVSPLARAACQARWRGEVRR